MARRSYRTGDIVRYQGRTQRYHGIYEVVRSCSCDHCLAEQNIAARAGAAPDRRWVIRDAERVLGCVSPASLTRA